MDDIYINDYGSICRTFFFKCRYCGKSKFYESSYCEYDKSWFIKDYCSGNCCRAYWDIERKKPYYKRKIKRYVDKKRLENIAFLKSIGIEPNDYYKSQKIMYSLLDQIFPDEFHIDNKYFFFNGKKIKPGGKRKGSFQYDRFYPKLRLVFEFDGNQHNQFVPFYHKSYDDFQRQIKRDTIKDCISRFCGITLIRITPKDLKLESIKNIIEEANKPIKIVRRWWI